MEEGETEEEIQEDKERGGREGAVELEAVEAEIEEGRGPGEKRLGELLLIGLLMDEGRGAPPGAAQSKGVGEKGLE